MDGEKEKSVDIALVSCGRRPVTCAFCRQSGIPLNEQTSHLQGSCV